MAGKRTELAAWPVPGMAVTAGFVVLSVLTFLQTGRVVSTAVLQLGILIAYGAMLSGIAARLPDLEVLAWLIAGTTTLVVEVEALPGSFWVPMATAVLVVLLADLAHSIAILYPFGGNEALGEDQAVSRRQILGRRVERLGATAGAALVIALIGTSIAPPLTFAGGSAAVVGILGATALASLTAVVFLKRSG